MNRLRSIQRVFRLPNVDNSFGFRRIAFRLLFQSGVFNLSRCCVVVFALKPANNIRHNKGAGPSIVTALFMIGSDWLCVLFSFVRL